jgi:hypothetical protein
VSLPSIDLVVETTRTIIIEIEGEGSTVATDGPEILLDLTLPGIQGPPGPQGPEGPQGPIGPAGAAREIPYDFAVPALVWDVTHDIVVTPSVYTYDTSGRLVEGDISYPTPSTVRVEWAWPMAGRLVVTT